MFYWLECVTSLGMFSTEYVVLAQTYSGETFSLLAHKDDVRVIHYLRSLLKVSVIKEDGDSAVIVLPQPSYEAGTVVLVHKSQLHRL